MSVVRVSGASKTFSSPLIWSFIALNFRKHPARKQGSALQQSGSGSFLASPERQPFSGRAQAMSGSSGKKMVMN
jgi:hypothetical protein